MLLKLSPVATNVSTREVGDPAHPRVRLCATSAWSGDDLRLIKDDLEFGECVHVTLTVPRKRPLLTTRRDFDSAERAMRDRLAVLAAVVGPDADRVMVKIERQPGTLERWWQAWAWRRGIGGPGRRPAGESCLDELLPADPDRDDLGDLDDLDDFVGLDDLDDLGTIDGDDTRRCEGRPHVIAAATTPLPLDVIDDLHCCVRAGLEAHLVLTLPRSPVLRDPDLHLLWERRMTLDVRDREREVAQLWPHTSLVQIEVVHTYPRRTVVGGLIRRAADRAIGPRRRWGRRRSTKARVAS